MLALTSLGVGHLPEYGIADKPMVLVSAEEMGGFTRTVTEQELSVSPGPGIRMRKFEL